MGIHSMRAALAALFACASTIHAGAQANQFCTSEADGRMKIGFEQVPALAVHDETLDVDFGRAEIEPPEGVSTTESLFSFARTLDSILSSAGVFGREAPLEARIQPRLDLLDSLIGTFNSGAGLAINPRSAILMPIDDRSKSAAEPGEGKLVSSDLLDGSRPNGMKPLALLNRVDLAPFDWATCGEFRIIYGTNSPAFENRFLLIFEAVVPNPAPATGLEGCRPLLAAWASLSNQKTDMAQIANAKKLSEIFYDGLEIQSPDGQVTSYEPAMSYRNLGGDAIGGQVRGNLFMTSPWQLREWLTQITVDGTELKLAFVPETVKNNPLAELFLDDLASNPQGVRLRDANIPVSIERMQSDFIVKFVNDMQKNIFAERDVKFADRKADADLFVNAGVDEDTIALNMIGLGSDPAFDEFQSSSDIIDDFTSGTNIGPRFKQLLEHLMSRPETTAQGGGLPRQNVEILLNRALAGTCAGCHETATGKPVKLRPNDLPLLWPATPRFVHVTEGRDLSDALTLEFLPFRRLVLAKALCTTRTAEPVASTGGSPYVIDKVIAAVSKEAMTMVAGSFREGALAQLGAVVPQLRAEAVAELSRLAAEGREAALGKPGAFVTQRRPH